MLVTKLWSYNHIYNIIWVVWWHFVGDIMERHYDVMTFILRRPRVAKFADIIKIGTMFIKTTFKDSNNLKELEIIY